MHRRISHRIASHARACPRASRRSTISSDTTHTAGRDRPGRLGFHCDMHWERSIQTRCVACRAELASIMDPGRWIDRSTEPAGRSRSGSARLISCARPSTSPRVAFRRLQFVPFPGAEVAWCEWTCACSRCFRQPLPRRRPDQGSVQRPRAGLRSIVCMPPRLLDYYLLRNAGEGGDWIVVFLACAHAVVKTRPPMRGRARTHARTAYK